TTANTGRGFISLKLREERKISADEVITRLRPKLAQVPGATLYLQAVQDVRLGGRISQAQYQFTLQSDNLEELNTWAPRLVRAMREMPELRDISSDQQNRGLEVPVTIDRATAPRLGVGTRMIDEKPYDAFGQRQVTNITGRLKGTALAFQEALKNQPILFLASLTAVYVVLGGLYESFIHPFTILSTLPSAGVGALVALMICGMDLSVIAIIGIILLIGLVKKNAILVIDVALDLERNHGFSARDS